MSKPNTNTHYLAVVTVRERRYGEWVNADYYAEEHGGHIDKRSMAERFDCADEAREHADRMLDWFQDQNDGFGEPLYHVVEANVEEVQTTTTRTAVAVTDSNLGTIKL